VDLLSRLLSYVNLAGAVHALIQSLVLAFTRRGNRLANRTMALFLLALAIGMASGMVAILDLYDIWPALAILTGPIVLSYSPLFYLYVRALTAEDHRRQLGHALHGIPFFLGMLAYGTYMSSPAPGSAPSGVSGFFVRSPWLAVLFLSVLQMIVYVVSVVRLLRAHSARIKAAYSMIDRVNLGWLRRRLAVYAAIWGVGLVLFAAVRLEARAVSLVGQFVFFLVALNTFVTGYRAMHQPEIISGLLEAEPGRRYERSSLSPENAALYETRLRETMEREKLFLDPELTLPKLARALAIPASHLSQVINERLGRNFFEFINGYRVDAARQRLASRASGQQKLVAVAFDCGFNSLATFNRVFKELAGRPPSDFRRHPDLP
jgi:AraC-like DNA-binding protein